MKLAVWAIWILVAGVLFVAEMLTLTFYLLWLGVGALVGAFVAFFVPDSLWLQVLFGSIVSIILSVFSKRITKDVRFGREYQDAIDTLVGKTGIVVKEITEETNGIVKVGGDTWSATADEAIGEGERVVILKRHSTIVYVKKECEE
ncbi:NfeD family protein [Microbacteriaceae bacterium 4G12]